MSGINTIHKVYLKVLTPVHIGGAQEKDLQENLDYLQLKGRTWRLDWEKVYQTFAPDKIADALINQRLGRLIESKIEDVAEEMENVLGSTGVAKSFIRDGMGRVFVPGSSIKGAMKSWTHSAIEKSLNITPSNDTLGKFENDVFRFIQPTDCYFENATRFLPTKTFNLQKVGRDWEGGWKHAFRPRNNEPATDSNFNERGFVTDFECLEKNAQGEFYLNLRNKLDGLFIRELYREGRSETRSYGKIFSGDGLLSLFQLINTQTKVHIERELHFFKTYNEAEYTDEVIALLGDLLGLANQLKQGQCILWLSAGSGFHGITGDFQFQDHTNTGEWNGRMKFKSRKIAFTSNEMFPMGFVLLSTTPFAKEEPSSKTQTEKESSKSSILVKVENQPQKELSKVEYKNATTLKQGDEVFAEVLELGKPHGTAKLFIKNYPFESEVLLSGIKNSGLVVGDKIRCEINSMTEDGKINMVKYLG